ncbi:unnamed protein product [Peniophora sp. CBMAI 1063]|nr:unnamed protein product [Peniophora sp. CBMAI 1063]
MAGSKDRILNKAQADAVGDVLKTEFAPTVTKLDPKFSGYSAVTQWAADRQARLFKENLVFQIGTITDEHKKAVDRKFRNYYRKLKATRSPKRSTGSLLNIVAPPPSAVELYEADVRDDILKEIPEGDDAAYKARLTEMWFAIDEESLAAYEAKAATGRCTIEERQKSLASNFGSALDQLCQDKALGGVLALSIIAYRGGDGKLRSTVFHGRAAEPAPQYGVDKDDEDKLKTFKEAWDQYADDHLPRASVPSVPSSKIAIPHNAAGIPVFPSIDPWSLSPGALMDYITEYMAHSWYYARKSRHPDGIPWRQIKENPSAFYDTHRHNYMCFDQAALKNAPVLYDFVAKLLQHCSIVSKEPFTFISGHAASRQTPSASAFTTLEGHDGRDHEESAHNSVHATPASGSSSITTLHVQGNEGIASTLTSAALFSSFTTPPGAGEPLLQSPPASPAHTFQDGHQEPTMTAELPKRGRKRVAPDETLPPAEAATQAVDDSSDPTPPKRRKRANKADTEDTGEPKGNPGQRQKRAQRSTTTRKAAPVEAVPAKPKPKPKATGNADASAKKVGGKTFQGWALDTGALRGRAITYEHYSKVGGVLLQEDDFDVRKSGRDLPARVIAEKDPAWFVKCQTWKAIVKRGPE